jgi:hypothetical protein
MKTLTKKSENIERVQKKLSPIQNIKNRKTLKAYKYLGILKIEEDPNDIQKRLRDEWK